MASKPDKSLIYLGKYLSLALTLPGCLVGGYFLGAVLDHWLHIPILRVLGLILGLVSGLLQIFRELARDDAKSKREQ